MAAYKDPYYNHLKHVSNIDMLREQEQLAIQYGYRKIPSHIAKDLYVRYMDELPAVWKNGDFKNKNISLELYNKAVIATGVTERGFVCGDYGVFLEIPPDSINHEVIKVQEGEEYRINDPKYANVKYHWYTDIYGEGIKLYHQQKKVSYADYKPGMWYISPYEVFVEYKFDDTKECKRTI